SSAVVVVHRAESVPCCFPQEHPFFHGRPLVRVAGRNYPPCQGGAHRYDENMTHFSLRPPESDIVGIAPIGHRKYKNIRVRRTQMLDPSTRGQPCESARPPPSYLLSSCCWAPRRPPVPPARARRRQMRRNWNWNGSPRPCRRRCCVRAPNGPSNPKSIPSTAACPAPHRPMNTTNSQRTNSKAPRPPRTPLRTDTSWSTAQAGPRAVRTPISRGVCCAPHWPNAQRTT